MHNLDKIKMQSLYVFLILSIYIMRFKITMVQYKIQITDWNIFGMQHKNWPGWQVKWDSWPILPVPHLLENVMALCEN